MDVCVRNVLGASNDAFDNLYKYIMNIFECEIVPSSSGLPGKVL